MFKTPLVLAALLLAAPGFGLAAQAKNWPAPIKAIEAQGVEIIGTFAAPGGLTGYAGMIQMQPLARVIPP